MFQIIKKYPEWVSRNPNTTLVSLFVFYLSPESSTGNHKQSRAFGEGYKGCANWCSCDLFIKAKSTNSLHLGRDSSSGATDCRPFSIVLGRRLHIFKHLTWHIYALPEVKWIVAAFQNPISLRSLTL